LFSPLFITFSLFKESKDELHLSLSPRKQNQMKKMKKRRKGMSEKWIKEQSIIHQMIVIKSSRSKKMYVLEKKRNHFNYLHL